MNNSESDYMKYRGKCQELSMELVEKDPSLALVRGFYICPLWGKQAHWWVRKQDGTIIDPSVKQFPTAGVCADYEEFNGECSCEECGKIIKEEDLVSGRVCSYECYGKMVGVTA